MLAFSSFGAICALALLITSTTSAGATEGTGELACLNEDGAPVDWYIAYKFPKIPKSDSELFRKGLAYAYLTSDDAAQDKDFVGRATGDDLESAIFLHQFKDLLVRFSDGFTPLAVSGSKHRDNLSKSDRKKSSKLASADLERRWTVSKIGIDQPGSIIMRTLAPAYDKSKSIDSIFYNDDPTRTDQATEGTKNDFKINLGRAHAKGVVLIDEKNDEGIWLAHSTPKFPKIRSNVNAFPISGVKHGQTYMCISFHVGNTAAKLIHHLYNMRPTVYDRQISDSLRKRFPDLDYLRLYADSKNQKIVTTPKLTQMITTRGGQVLHLFSKSVEYKDDIYGGWIDEVLGADLYVESWRNAAGGVLNSSCPMTKHHVNNIKDLKYDDKVSWSYLKDHSKWAITDAQEVATVCIGDMNRMASQFNRGGGAICIKCPTCWSVFSNTIQDTEPCPKSSHSLPPSVLTSEEYHDKTLIARIKSWLNL